MKLFFYGNFIDNYTEWSPDGNKIVYVSEKDGNQEIYVMTKDGYNQTRLTINSAQDYAPTWSPY